MILVKGKLHNSSFQELWQSVKAGAGIFIVKCKSDNKNIALSEYFKSEYCKYEYCKSDLKFNSNTFAVENAYTGCFLHWVSPKKLKYGKPRLGESTLT